MSLPEKEARDAMEKYQREQALMYQRPSVQKLHVSVEMQKLPERDELRRDYNRAGLELMGIMADLQQHARIRFVPNEYSFMRLAEVGESMLRDLSSAAIDFDSFEDMKPEIAPVAKLLAADQIRSLAFSRLLMHSWGFLKNYYDNKNQQATLVTGRLMAAASDDFKDAFGGLNNSNAENGLPGLELSDEERFRLEQLGIPEGIYLNEQVSRMTADMVHIEESIAAMGRYNPNKPEGQEMFKRVPEVEQDLLARVFKIDWKKEKGSPNDSNYKPENTRRITVNGKSFYINLLSYYMTVSTLEERIIYEASIKAMLEVRAVDRLKDLPENLADFQQEHETKFAELSKDISTTRARILRNLKSPVKPARARLADYAYEQGYMIQTASLNIAELARRNKWVKKDGVYDFEIDIPGPETGQDAVNGTNALVHETFYAEKGRGVTDIMPYVDVNNPDAVNKAIKLMFGEVETDPEAMKQKILSNRNFAMGAAILDLYPGETGVLTEDDLKKVRNIRGDLQMNPIITRVLRNLLWEFPVAVGEGGMIPMPIKPALDSFNLWKVMKNTETGESVADTLKKPYGRLTDVDWDKTVWYTADAWEVNMKMLNDVLAVMYGRQDPRVKENLFSNPTAGLGEIIKKLDIGGRSEGWTMWLPKEDGSGKLEQVNVPKGVLEITYAAYLIVTHLAMSQNGIWNGNRWDQSGQAIFWNGAKDINGLDDWIEAALYKPKNKKSYDFPHYRDSLVLLLRALAEWYAGPAPTAKNEYTEKIKPRVRQIIDGNS